VIIPSPLYHTPTSPSYRLPYLATSLLYLQKVHSPSDNMKLDVDLLVLYYHNYNNHDKTDTRLARKH